ncbi:Arm DNA-binding domain-containing protein, partial [Vibrio sp. 10N.222.49.E5]|uniref:Arm DNA-binding domain-containing protein n=1 Tax=Vibrio sp. 10N.222.49.E5 TaxID=3229617 RepID=UPI00354BA756
PEGRDQAKKSDGNGLFLLAKNNGTKLWRLRYKYAGKHQEMALGKYPTVGLADARDLAKEARVLLIQGINPMDERRERKRKSSTKELGFEAVAIRWWEQQKD